MNKLTVFIFLVLLGIFSLFITPLHSQNWGNNDDRLTPVSELLVNGTFLSSPTSNTIVVGNLLYYADYYGFQIYDISDASAPGKVGGIPLPGKATYFAMDGNIVYVCTELGIVLVDVSDPALPEAINFEFLDFSPYQVAVDGSVLYVAGIEILRSYSISEANSLEFLAERNIPPSLAIFAGITKYDNYVYYSNAEALYVIDVSNPEDLWVAFNTVYNTGGLCWGNIAIKDEYLIVPTTIKLLVYNLTNPASPALVYSDLPTNHTIYDIVIEDNVMVLSHNSPSGMWSIFDITYPDNPILLYENNQSPTHNLFSLGTLKNNMLYILDDGQEGYEGYTIHLIDISSVTNPTQMSEIKSLPGRSRSVSRMEKGGNQYALIAQENYGNGFRAGFLRIMDVTDIENPVLISTLDLPNQVVSVEAISDKYAFLTIAEFVFTPFPKYNYKLALVDIQDVTNPYVADIYDNYGEDLGVACNSNMSYYNGYLYTVSATKLCVFKESSGSIILVGSVNIYGSKGTGVFAYTPEYVLVAGGTYGLQLYNVTNPSSPFLANYYDTPGFCWDVYVDNGIAYVADYTGGMSVFDVSQPIAIIPLSQVDCVENNATSVVTMNNMVYVGLREGRIQMFDISHPTVPQDRGWYITNGTMINDMIIDYVGNDAFLYVANELVVSVFKLDSNVGISEGNEVNNLVITNLQPNPADLNCYLELTIPDDSFVKIDLFDANGRKIKTCHQGAMTQGNYEIKINMASLPNGLYFVETSVNNNKHTQKLIIQH